MGRSSKTLLGRLLTGVVLAVVLAASLSGARPSDKQSVALLGEVKLRKLHLVRPDLIPYPIAYEVFC